ncbi:MAG TPA: hypothetical protein VGG44_12045 [Tepidisphaeraceae bacterium]|jgi:hypothetical protein
MASDSSPHPHIDDHVFGHWVLGFAKPSGTSARVGLIISVVIGCAIFTAGSRSFGLPALPGYDGSILHQPSPAAAFLTIAILMLVATLLGTIIAGAVRFEAGLFTAALSLATISFRCGTMQSVLFETGGKESVFISLAVELLIFAIILALLWSLLWFLGRANAANDLPPAHSASSENEFIDCFTAVVTQIIATGVVMMFLCQSEAKNQSLAAVAIASFMGTFIAYKYAPVRPSVWYWSGPLVIGLVGYILAAMGQDANLAIGSPVGTFAALARPLPIDYASVGPAGSILAYWMLRKNEVVAP